MDGHNPAKPRQYWLTAQALFTKLAKLFQLGFSGLPVKTLQTRANIDLAAVLAVDFGTSPHGLFASLSRSHQETSGKAGDRFPAKPVLTVGELPPVKRSGRGDSTADAPAPMGLYRLELTEAQRAHLAFAVLCQVEDLEQSHEAGHAEVQEAIGTSCTN